MIAHFRRLLRAHPSDAEMLAVLRSADLRHREVVLAEIDTLKLHAVRPRYGEPAEELPGQNRWPTHGARWPVVKAGRDRWVDVGTGPGRPLSDDEVAEYPRGRAP